MSKIELLSLRKKIDEIDSQLITLLAKRMKIVAQVNEFKKKNKLRIEDKKREEEVLKRGRKKARILGLSENLVARLLRLIIKEAKLIQKK